MTTFKPVVVKTRTSRPGTAVGEFAEWRAPGKDARSRRVSAPRRLPLLLLAVTAILFVVAAPARAAFPGKNGVIVYQSDVYEIGNFDIYKGPSATPVRLTDDPGEDYGPAISPDGTKIAYANNSWQDIFVMNMDGSGKTALNAFGYAPAWSPDGAKIAYTRMGDLWVMNADGTDQQFLIDNGDEAAWSPDGAKIVFVRGSSLMIANADGTGEAILAPYGISPAWAPDGSKIVYQNWGSEPGLHLVKPDGTGHVRLSVFREDESPAFSPDGLSIVFTSSAALRFQSGPVNWELFACPLVGGTLPDVGSTLQRVTNNFPAYDSQADWQPLPVEPPTPVFFADPNLEAAVREALQKPEGQLTVTDVESLTTLDASNRGIRLLGGLEYAVNLTSLNLSLNLITDLAALVNNSGLGSGDTIDVTYNYLDSGAASADMAQVQALRDRTAAVSWYPQRQFPSPFVTAGSSVVAGESYTGGITFAQAAPLLRLTVDFGDGTTAELTFAADNSASFSHVYEAAGVYTLIVTAEYDAVSPATPRTVTVTNSIPPEQSTFEELLARTLTSFDGWIAGTSADGLVLSGLGPNARAAAGQLGALRNMLVRAGVLAGQGTYAEARSLLLDAYLKTDGQTGPPDFAGSTAAPTLAALIQQLMSTVPGA